MEARKAVWYLTMEQEQEEELPGCQYMDGEAKADVWKFPVLGFLQDLAP